MGKHAARRRGPGRGRAAVGSAAALVVAVVLAGAYVQTSGDEAPGASALAPGAVSSTDASTPTNGTPPSRRPSTLTPSASTSPPTRPDATPRGPGASPSPEPSTSPRPSRSPGPGGAPASSPAQRACGREVSAADAAVALAAGEVSRWERHLDATAVLLRRPDDPRATATLRRTRVAAADGIASFTAADRAYRAAFGACAELARSTEASRCQRRAAAANATVAWARAAIDDWARHLAVARERGRDPRTARLLTSSQPDIFAFRSTSATLRRAPSCPLEETS